MEKIINIGDIVQVSTITKFTGYLVKNENDVLYICYSDRPDPRGTTAIRVQDVVGIEQLAPVTAKTDPDPKNNLLKFPIKEAN